MSETLLYLEDLPVGTTLALGERTVAADEIVAFGREFDPQPFHIDPVAAAHSPFGGLIASGWHISALVMRLMVDAYLCRSASYGSPGIDRLRWHKPLRPGDTLSGKSTVIDNRPSESKPDRGVIRITTEAYNQRGELVLSMEALGIFARRSWA